MVSKEETEQVKKTEPERSVVPGEVIGTEEEFLAGSGTWTDKYGTIHASLAGRLVADENRLISVTPVNIPPTVEVGSVVYGRIVEMFESVAFVDVEVMALEKEERVLVLSGVVPVSEIKDAFVPSIRDELRVGDIVKAAVSKITPFRLELSLKPEGMGVIKAFCSYDRKEMDQKGDMVVCSVCGHKGRRRLGTPYGKMGKPGEKSTLKPRPEKRTYRPRRDDSLGGPRGGFRSGPRRDSRGSGPRRSGGRDNRGSRGGDSRRRSSGQGRGFRSSFRSGRGPGQAKF